MTAICALCQEHHELCRSHLLPHALYQLGAGPHVSFSASSALLTSTEVRLHLLCSYCEDRFNKRGEDWVLRNIVRSNTEFGLWEKLQAARKAQTGGNVLYTAADASQVDTVAIEYFAASILWRSSAAEWPRHDGPLRIELGRYAEELRKFLYVDGTPFPDDIILLVTVAEPPHWELGSTFPEQGRTSEGKRCVEFLIPGIRFFAIFAKHLAPGERSVAFSSSPKRYISGDDFRGIRQRLAANAYRSIKKGKLARQFR